MRRRPGRAAPRAIAIAAVLGAGTVALAGCDGTTSHGYDRISAGSLVVYSSLPLSGANAGAGRAVLDGERLALSAARSRVGRYRIQLRVLDDATASGPEPGLTSANATLAAGDSRTIGYIGELDSGTTAVSLPLLNRADIPQISPLSTALGLTRGGPESAPGEPQKYYPSGTRTFVRVVPNDAIQATVLAALQVRDGCTGVFILSDEEVEGREAADSVVVADRAAGLRLAGVDEFQATGHGVVSLASIVARIADVHPDCVVLSALLDEHAASVADAIARALPNARLFLTSSLATPAFVAPSLGGVSLSVDHRLTVTAPTLSFADYPPAARRFAAAFRRRYGSQPGVSAGAGIWGDAAMALMLDAIARASDDGRHDVTRGRVVAALFATRRLASVLGTYSIDAAGDTTLSRFGVYRVVDGQLRFSQALRG